MNQPTSTPSVLERWIAGVLGVLLAVVIVVWAWEASRQVMQFVFIVAGFALVLLLVLSIAAWRHGFRWFFSRRAWRFYAWLVAGIISVLVLFYAEESWRGKRTWAALQREASARGESLELSSVAPPPVSDAENFALAPGVAGVLGYAARGSGEGQALSDTDSEILSFNQGRHTQRPTANWALQQATDLAAWQTFFRRHPLTDSAPTDKTVDRPAFPVATEPQTPAADVLLALSRYDSALAVLRAASQRPKVRYPIAYEDGLFALQQLNHHFVETLAATVRILCLRAVAELVLDRNDAALQDTLLALRLAESLRQEPYNQLHHARAAMLQLCLQPVWEGLTLHRWKEAQLITLQQHFAKMDLLDEFRLRVRGETLVTMNLADQLQALFEGRRSAWMHGLGADFEEWFWIWVARVAYPRGWLYQDKAWIYRFYEQRSDVLKALDPANSQQWRAELRRATDPFLLMLVVPRLSEVFHQATPSALYLQTACQEASVACALERYRLAQGQYPDSLDALVPAWLKQVPADLLDQQGSPLRYRREADGGFVLYSIGLNRLDDHGKPVPAHKSWEQGSEPFKEPFPILDQGDWAWIQPGPHAGLRRQASE